MYAQEKQRVRECQFTLYYFITWIIITYSSFSFVVLPLPNHPDRKYNRKEEREDKVTIKQNVWGSRERGRDR